MNLQMAMTGNANRAWRCALFPNATGAASVKTATVDNIVSSRLLFQFITPRASDMLDPRNMVPYYKVPVFKATSNLMLPGRALRGQAPDASTFVAPEVRTVTSSNIQLNGIPDKLIVCGRHQTDNYATI